MPINPKPGMAPTSFSAAWDELSKQQNKRTDRVYTGPNQPVQGEGEEDPSRGAVGFFAALQSEARKSGTHTTTKKVTVNGVEVTSAQLAEHRAAVMAKRAAKRRIERRDRMIAERRAAGLPTPFADADAAGKARIVAARRAKGQPTPLADAADAAKRSGS